MECIQSIMFMSLCFKSSALSPLPDVGDFKAAGCVFTNGKVLLAGYQKEEYAPAINGIGGKRTSSTESYIETALRETIEELFGIIAVPPGLLMSLQTRITPTRIHKTGSYVLVMYSFADLDILLQEAYATLKSSPVYEKFPRTLSDLILHRNANYEPRPEITHLCILPVVKDCCIDSQLLDDMLIVNPNLTTSFRSVPDTTEA
jgi:hypothetical protein